MYIKMYKALSESKNQNCLLFGNAFSDYILEKLYPNIIDLDKDNKINVASFDNIKEILSLIRNKPFKGKYYYINVDYSTLKKQDKSLILKFLKTKYEHLYFVVTITDIKDIMQVRKEKFIKDNTFIDVINTKYLPHKFYTYYIFENIRTEITEDAVNLVISYLDDKINILPYYINIFNKFRITITREVAKQNVPDLRMLDIVDYIEGLLLCKKTIPVKAVSDLYEKYKPSVIYTKLNSYVDKMIAVKKLMYKGDIIYANAYKDIQVLKANKEIPKIVDKMSVGQIKKFLRLLKPISLKELILFKMFFMKLNRSELSLLVGTMLLQTRKSWDTDTREYVEQFLIGNIEI